MRKLALLVLAAALCLAPQAAMAQAARPPAPLMPPAPAPAPLLPQVQAEIQAQAQKVGDVFGLTANQVLYIGAGAIGGLVVAEALHVAAVIGAIAGGAIGNWWYAQNETSLLKR